MISTTVIKLRVAVGEKTLICGGRTIFILSCFLPIFHQKFVLKLGCEGIVTVVLPAHAVTLLHSEHIYYNKPKSMARFIY